MCIEKSVKFSLIWGSKLGLLHLMFSLKNILSFWIWACDCANQQNMAEVTLFHFWEKIGKKIQFLPHPLFVGTLPLEPCYSAVRKPKPVHMGTLHQRPAWRGTKAPNQQPASSTRQGDEAVCRWLQSSLWACPDIMEQRHAILVIPHPNS